MRKSALRLFGVIACLFCFGADAASERDAAVTNATSFPDPNQVLQGRVFENKFDRDVFFLRRIQKDYPAHWPALLAANITPEEYTHSPQKLLRFVEQLGAAMEDVDDSVAITNLAPVVSSPVYYANTNGYYPEILRAAALSLIKLGPRGRQALANAFSVDHYRQDSPSLETLAQAIGSAGSTDAALNTALAVTVFQHTASNGGSYPRCTRELTRLLLGLPRGVEIVRTNLVPKAALEDPARFDAVVEGVAAARAANLLTNLTEILQAADGKLAALSAHPSPYVDELLALKKRLQEALVLLRQPPVPPQAQSGSKL